MESLKNQALVSLDKILFPSVITFVNNFPALQTSLILAYWFFWVVMQYKQNEINDFIQLIINNPWIFAKEVIETKEFEDWFLVIFETYLKERSNEKREIIKNIFLWFAELSQGKKENYELERILDITNKITFPEITFLKYINENGSLDFKSKEKSWFNVNLTTIRFDFLQWRQLLALSDTNSLWEIYSDLIYWLISLWIVKQINKENANSVNFTSINSEKKESISIELTKLWRNFISYIND